MKNMHFAVYLSILHIFFLIQIGQNRMKTVQYRMFGTQYHFKSIGSRLVLDNDKG